nr:hypothetical protein Iba_chr06dCG3680 [Ipomoea batatas]
MVLDSTNSAIDSACRENAEGSISMGSFPRSIAEGGTMQMWGSESRPNFLKESSDSSNSMSKKKRLVLVFGSGLFARNEEARREKSFLRAGKLISGLEEWRRWKSKKMRREKGRGVGTEIMRFRSWSVRWITPVDDSDRRRVKSDTTALAGMRQRVRVRVRVAWRRSNGGIEDIGIVLSSEIQTEAYIQRSMRIKRVHFT